MTLCYKTTIHDPILQLLQSIMLSHRLTVIRPIFLRSDGKYKIKRPYSTNAQSKTARARTPPATNPSCAITAPDPFDDDCVVEALAEGELLAPAEAIVEAVAPAEEAAPPPVTPRVV